MSTRKAFDGKPYSGNPHVRFDEGEVAPAATPRRGSLLYMNVKVAMSILLAVACLCSVSGMSAAVLPAAQDDAARMGSAMMNPGSALRSIERAMGGDFKVLVYGNSIALHGPKPDIGWTNNCGMAASAPDKDFAHLVVAGLEAKLGKKADFRIRNVAAFERNFTTNVATAVEVADDIAWQPDYVVVAVGENVPKIGDSNSSAYRQFLADIARPFVERGSKVVLRSPFWKNDAKAACTACAASDAGALYVDAGPLGAKRENKAIGLFKHGGVANHPGDLGMRRLADQILEAFARANAVPERTHSFKTSAKMEMLRPGEVKPQGWLRSWCMTGRDGYISRLDEIHPAFSRAWAKNFHPRGEHLGWSHDDGSWCFEGGGYWFEGLVRLAWELDDAGLKELAKKRLEPILGGMNPNSIAFLYWMDRNDPAQVKEIDMVKNGFVIGACGRSTRAVLAYYEATGDERALRALTWCLDDPRFFFRGNPLTLPAAACDTWRYNGDAKIAAAMDSFCATKPYPEKWPAMRYGVPIAYDTLRLVQYNDRMPERKWDWRLQHGVLCYESMLTWVKASLWTGDGKYLANVRAWLDFHERVCRQPHGVIVADEQFGWAGPGRGTETCTVAGDLLLYATLAGVTGEGRFADHVERSFFNAGAACTSRDFMRHVYFQAPNRTEAVGDFHTGPGIGGGVFKAKHFPLCCTAALARILPGYVQWMWMKPAAGGLAATLYAPNVLETKLGETSVRIETKTDYPFNESLEMTVSTEKPMAFPLKLRVPEWCPSPIFNVNGEAVSPAIGDDGFAVIDREWRLGDKVSLKFPMSPGVETMRDFNDGGKPYCSVSYGPLLFAYALPEKDENNPAPGARLDWSLDPSHVLDGAKVVRSQMPEKWNWPRESPVRLTVQAADGAPLELVPYGCAKLRLSMFPVAASPSQGL